MVIKLTHLFIKRSHDIEQLLNGVKKLATFCSRLEKQSKLYPNRYDPDRYKGDGLELFTEALIKLSPIDNRIGIVNYQPVTSNDIGVDGKGIGIDGKPATVQVKYRKDHSKRRLTANEDHLSNFVSASTRSGNGGFGVPSDTTTNMLIVTTAPGLNHFTDEEMFGKQVRCIGYEQLRKLVDNNLPFWNCFRELVREAK